MRKRLYQGSICFVTTLLLMPMFVSSQPVCAKGKTKVPKQYFVVSRMEDGVVLLEDGQGIEQETSKSKLPKRIREGDVLSYHKGKYRKDLKKTKERRKRIEAYMEGFWQ